MASQKLTPEERLFFAKEFLSSGCSVTEWAKAYGINRTAIYSWLKEFNLSLPSENMSTDSSNQPKQEVVKLDMSSCGKDNEAPVQPPISIPNIYPDNLQDFYSDCDCEISIGELKISFTRNLPPELLTIICKHFGRQS